MKREIFRLSHEGRPLAILGDERALRLCLPVLRERELVHIGRCLLQTRLLATHRSVTRSPEFPIEVRDMIWMCRRDEA
jgi:hypothetical protein